MKVAIVYHYFPHYRGPVLRELCASSEHEYILFGDDRALDPTIKLWNCDVPERFHAARCYNSRRLGLLWQRGVIELARRRDVHAIIYLGNPYYLSTWMSAALARSAGKRVLFWTHGWTSFGGGPKSWLRNLFYSKADGLLLYGHYAKAIGMQRGFSPESLYVIYNSLDYERQRHVREQVSDDDIIDTRREFFANPQRPLIICSARLRGECRFELLIKAQAELDRTGHHINLLFVGDGPERQRLETLASSFGVSARFFGSCYDEPTLARLTMSANATVSPGKVGLTAMQSLAYGTPVITHSNLAAQMPEFEAIVAGRTGDFFRNDDIGDLARVIKQWTAASLPNSATRQQCHEVIERFYNPQFQRRAIDRAVRGLPADDLFWLREDATRIRNESEPKAIDRHALVAT